MPDLVSAFEIDSNVSELSNQERIDRTNQNLLESQQIDKGGDLEQDTYDWIYQLWKSSDDFLNQYYIPMWDLCYDHYFGRKPVTRGDGSTGNVDEEKQASNINIRHGYIQVESSAAQIVNSLMRDLDSLYQIFPPHYTDKGMEQANALRKSLIYQFTQEMDPVSLLHGWVQQGEITGLSPFKISYKFIREDQNITRPVQDIYGNIRGLHKRRESVIVCDRPDFVIPSIYNIWWNHDCTGVNDVRWVIERSYYSIAELRTLANNGVFDSTAVEEMITKYYDNAYVNKEEQYRTDIEHTYNVYDPIFCIFELWMHDRLINWSNDFGVIIRDRDNIFDNGQIPYFFYPSAAVRGQLPGIGQIEAILDLSDESNTKRNQRIDNIDMIINPQIVAGPRAQIPGNTLTFVPRGVINARAEDIDLLTIPDATAAAFQEDERIKNDIDETNANHDIGRGESLGNDATATEAQIRTQQGNQRKEVKMKYLYRQFYQASKAQWQLNRQFGSTNLMIKIAGPDGAFKRENPLDYYGDDWVFSFGQGGFLHNRILSEQRLSQDMSQMAQTPMNEFVDWERFTEIYMKSKASDFPGLEQCIKAKNNMVLGFDRDPVQENQQFLRYGRPIEVTPGEDHSQHIKEHMPYLDMVEVPDEIKKLIQKHIAQHYRYLQNDFQAMGQLGGRISAAQAGQVRPQNMQDLALNFANAPGTPGGAGNG